MWYAYAQPPFEAAMITLKLLFTELGIKPVEPSAQTFTMFTQLPPEIRLLIWRAAFTLPHRDARTGYNIWQSDYRNVKNWRLPPKRKAPTGLLRACYESRSVALTEGSFLIRRHMLWFNIPSPFIEYIWVNNSVKTLMMPVNINAFAEISSFPPSLQSVASILPTAQWIQDMLLLLGSNRHRHNIRTIMDGHTWIPLRYSRGCDTETHPCVDSDTAAVTLDDPKLLDYLTSAFECHARKTLGERITRVCHRKSARNFLAWNKYISVTLLGRERYLIPDGFELKPVIVFGRPCISKAWYLKRSIVVMDKFVCRSEDDLDIEEWDDETDFGSNSTVFDPPTWFSKQIIRELIGQ
ncbi:hypothetical protein FLONG3_5202 [Fusarium longipes]|uniref:2EXR domain-containing protein n=1 Tax=Fusarium longipes TaxID=694270 RepID=A0A395SXG5_9HYPO|nr:hypothetical protein FLONG3_5202 [Fusarium longipes]